MKKTSNIIPVTAIVATLLAVIYRVFQLLIVVDYNEMGFYDLNAGYLTCYGIYILFGLAAIIMIVGAFAGKKKEIGAFVYDARALTPKQTAALGISFLAASALKFYDLAFSFTEISLDFLGEAIIFAVFAFMGFMLLSKRTVRPSVGYMQILICISFTLKAAFLFMQDTIITRVSDELILLLSYIASVLFFLALGRFLSGNEAKRTRGKLLVCGCITAMFSACASLSGYIALMVDSKYMSEHMAMHPLSQLGATVIALTVLIALYSKDKLETYKLEESE